MESYNSIKDTLDHRSKVVNNVNIITNELLVRAHSHDESKLHEPELPIFNRVTPILKELTYGTVEYSDQLDTMKVALDHHYSSNRHHPQYFESGILDMNLIDIVEMLCDWKAATERMKDGDIYESIRINKDRFEFSDELEKILINTARLLESTK